MDKEQMKKWTDYGNWVCLQRWVDSDELELMESIFDVWGLTEQRPWAGMETG